MPRTAVVVIAACGIGCHSPASTDSPADVLLDQGAVDVVAHEVHSGFTAPDRFVVRNAWQWRDVWDRTHVPQSDVPQRPTIDFSSDMVVVAALGAQASSGYDVSIERVISRGGSLILEVLTRSPSSNCYVLAVITSPVVIVRLPAFPGRLEFTERHRVVDCE